MRQDDMRKVLEIGVMLSEEQDPNRLLEKILECVMELARCDAGTLYLLDKDSLRFKIMRNHALHTYEGGNGVDPGLPPVPLSRENVCAFSLLAITPSPCWWCPCATERGTASGCCS